MTLDYTQFTKLTLVRMKQISEASLEDELLNAEYMELERLKSVLHNLNKIAKGEIPKEYKKL